MFFIEVINLRIVPWIHIYKFLDRHVMAELEKWLRILHALKIWIQTPDFLGMSFLEHWNTEREKNRLFQDLTKEWD